jgi:phospholipase C
MVIDPLLRAEAQATLRHRIQHLVVLMMENRSFDQMLGYLSLNGRDDVEGLRADMSNPSPGRTWGVHKLERTSFLHHEDPNHSGDWVAKQINGGAMDGFVTSYIDTRKEKAAAAKETYSPVMGYLDGEQLPVYDHLAEHFCVCDHWFASVAGATWPNRLFAAAGESGGRKSNQRRFGLFDWPFYSLPAFVRHLEKTPYSWRWYSAEPLDTSPPTIQLIDERYRHRRSKNFALFDERELGTGQPSFLDDAASGKLANVSWIDPNFHHSLLGVGATGIQNDDHPPADVLEGQRLVGKVANALMAGPQWEKTMLVVTYDEHGGMFDHVAPPLCDDDRRDFRRLGVRVPAIVVCPWVPEQSVAKQVLDHTAIIRTILECFRPEAIGMMGRRVGASAHLGGLLTHDGGPRVAVAPAPETPEASEESRQAALSPEQRAEIGREGEASRQVDALRNVPGEDMLEVAPSPEDAVANDLQLGLAAAAGELRELRFERVP